MFGIILLGIFCLSSDVGCFSIGHVMNNEANGFMRLQKLSAPPYLWCADVIPLTGDGSVSYRDQWVYLAKKNRITVLYCMYWDMQCYTVGYEAGFIFFRIWPNLLHHRKSQRALLYGK